MANAKILVIQDDSAGVADLEECLKGLGYTVCASVSSGQQAIEKAAGMCPDVALIDLGLKGDVNGTEVGERIGSRFDIPVIYLTDDAEGSLLQRAQETEPFGFVLKPVVDVHLHLTIDTALRQHRRQNKLTDQVQLMESVLESISDAVIAVNKQGDFLIFNAKARQIAGTDFPRADFSERSRAYGIYRSDKVTLFPEEDLPLSRAMLGESSDNVLAFVRNAKNQQGLYINISGRPLRDPSGVIKGGVTVNHDVTNLIRAEENLASAFVQGRQEVIDVLMHNIGNAVNSIAIGISTVEEHLIRGPLLHRLTGLADAIRGHEADWLDYLRNDPQGRQVRPFLLALADDFNAAYVQLRQTVRRIKDRVEHVTDIIRTQKTFGSDSMKVKDVPLETSINTAVSLLQESLIWRGITVGIDCRDAPKEIRIRESQFHQMLINLIKNAIEAIEGRHRAGTFDEPPTIDIKAYLNGEFLALDVSDNGIGIDPANLQQVLVAGYTTKSDGSGLGLHSVANFVAGMGGLLQPLSTGIGAGTTMRVLLKMSSIAVPE